MANFTVNASPSMAQFGSFIVPIPYDMLSINNGISPIANNGVWNRYSFQEYQNQSFFRYRIFCFVGQGTVRISFPYDTGQVSDTGNSLWFRVSNVSDFIITATAAPGKFFTGWSTGPGNPIFATGTPYTLTWNAFTSNTIFANFV